MIEPNVIVKRFLDADGRIKEMPVKQPKLIEVLSWLATAFEPDRRYSEKEVNEIIQQFHPDYCTLRRALIDYRKLTRANNTYWRNTTPTTPPAPAHPGEPPQDSRE